MTSSGLIDRELVKLKGGRMKRKTALILIFALGLGACASQLHRGVVAMKVTENVAHVGLNKSEVSVGDHVELYGNRCTGTKDEKMCQKFAKGHGTVTQVISDDYAAVKFDAGVTFQEGDFIEKHTH